MVDADPQGSALDWSASAEEHYFPVIGLPKKSLHRELQSIGSDYDHVVIDGPPRIYDVARSAIVASDVVLIPVQPSPYDVWASQEIVDLLEETSAFKEKQKRAFVINRKIVNTAIGRDVVEALSGYEIPVFSSHISQRVAFAECAGLGKTVYELEPKGPATGEIESLVKEVLAFAND